MKKTIFLILAACALVLGNSTIGDAASGHGGFGGHSGGSFAARGGHFGGQGGHFDGRGGHFEGRGGHFGGHFHGHDDHFNVGVIVGPGWEPWWGPYPYDNPYDYTAPVIVQSAPAVIVEPDQDQDYWYFCSDPSGYYPYVRRCPGGWMRVVPSPTPAGP
jgi:hypothetical protein